MTHPQRRHPPDHPADGPAPSRAVVPRQGQALLDADLDQQPGTRSPGSRPRRPTPSASPGRLVVPAASTGVRDHRGRLARSRRDRRRPRLPRRLAAGEPRRVHPHHPAAPPHRGERQARPTSWSSRRWCATSTRSRSRRTPTRRLGDAQAAGRSLVDWQVFPFSPAAPWTAPGCGNVTAHPDWARLVAPSTGTLAVVPDSAPPATDPCSLAPAGGYSRAENLCFRIEVDGGTVRIGLPHRRRTPVRAGRAAGEAVASQRIGDGAHRRRQRLRRDRRAAGARPAQLVRPRPPRRARLLARRRGPARCGSGAPRVPGGKATDSVVTLDAAAAATLAGKTGWFLRLWDAFPDGKGTATVTTTSTEPDVSQDIDLGDGVKIRLGAGAGGATSTTFRRGDHWTFAARADGCARLARRKPAREAPRPRDPLRPAWRCSPDRR